MAIDLKAAVKFVEQYFPKWMHQKKEKANKAKNIKEETLRLNHCKLDHYGNLLCNGAK